jgi:hypothetical protein
LVSVKGVDVSRRPLGDLLLKKIVVIVVVGLVAGLLDLIPLILVQVPLFNMLTIMVFWLCATLFIAQTRFLGNGALNGLVIALILMLPTAMAVSAVNPTDFFPMMFMALILGPLVGFTLDRVLADNAKAF